MTVYIGLMLLPVCFRYCHHVAMKVEMGISAAKTETEIDDNEEAKEETYCNGKRVQELKSNLNKCQK